MTMPCCLCKWIFRYAQNDNVDFRFLAKAQNDKGVPSSCYTNATKFQISQELQKISHFYEKFGVMD